jgi:integrase/recombinase XerC/integrase/recombinase XerD
MRNYSPRTIKTYEGVIRLFASYVWARQHSDPSKLVIYEKDLKKARFDTTVHITALVISDYLTFISSQYTYRPKTLHRVISTLSSFYRFLVSQGIMESNPAAGVERPRVKHQELIYMKHSQVLALIASIEDPRDRLIVRTIYATGVRVSELCGISIEDIDFEEHVIRIRGKGGKIRIVFVDEDTLGEIRKFLDGRMTGPLFIGQNGKNLSPRTVQNLFRQYAPKGITPHKIRHSYASELYRRSKNLRVVQENLGHSSIMTTEIYLHTDVDERKRVYNRYFPLSSKDDEREEGEGNTG